MVSFRSSGRQGEVWADHTLPWPGKSLTSQERMEVRLGSTSLHDLLIAMEALEKQGPEAGRLLRSIVQHDARKYREGKRQLYLSMLLIVLVLLAILCWNVHYPGIVGGASVGALLTVWLASPCTLSWYEDYKTYRIRLSNAVALLHRMPLPIASTEMLEALVAGDSRTASLAAKSLTQLLPQLTETDGSLLQAKHQNILRRALRGYDSDLILAILKASDRILNAAAIPDVRCLTHCPDWIAESEQIQLAARRSLATLTADTQRRQTMQTLLRASSPLTTPPEELLRQAAGVAVGSAHQMLRASEAPSPAVSKEQSPGLKSGLCALSSPPCPADTAQYPSYP